jgi:hypothetical protein
MTIAVTDKSDEDDLFITESGYRIFPFVSLYIMWIKLLVITNENIIVTVQLLIIYFQPKRFREKWVTIVVLERLY